MKGRILVTTDGTPGSLGAFRLAHALAERDGSPVDVLTVLEPIYMEGMAFYRAPGSAAAREDLSTDILLAGVQEQLQQVGGAATQWEVRVEIGSVAPTIVRYATAREASLIAVGIGEHKAVDRWLRTETALEVIHLCHIPVFTAQPTLAGLPQSALVAVDFSEYSRDAALTVAQLLEAGAQVHLVHVAWALPPDASEERREWMNTYRVGSRTRLRELAYELEAQAHVRVRTSLIDGEPARELLRLAEFDHSDVIATGSHGHGFFSRILRGSTSTKLVRGARCSVLVAPPRVVSGELQNALARGAERERREGSGLLTTQPL